MMPFFPSFVPGLVQTFPFVLAFALLCAPVLRRHAGAFYLVWGVIVAIFSWAGFVEGCMGDATPTAVSAFDMTLQTLEQTSPVIQVVSTLFTSSFAGVSFFLIVMFIGAMRPSPLVKRLYAARSELSILGGIIIFGHVLRIFDFPANFSNEKFAAVWGPVASAWMIVATAVIGALLTIFFLIPWVTSFPVIRRRMKPRSWKRLQRVTCYPFMYLMLAQGFCLAIGHALIGFPWNGSQTQMALVMAPQAWLASFAMEVATAAVYAMLAIVYTIMRLNRANEERARRRALRGRAQTDDATDGRSAGVDDDDVERVDR